MGPLTYFAPQPAVDEVPLRLPDPFHPAPPHPLAQRAARELQTRLVRLPALDARVLSRGKMFGVLVVRDQAGQIGALAGFSGMLDGAWHAEGFVGPVFDVDHRQAVWPAGEAELETYDRRLEELAARLAQAGAVEARTLETERVRVKRAQRARSNQLLEALFAGYRIPSAGGEARSLRELFAPAMPPGGAADCAGPKLFAHALRAGLQPVAGAEFWWGPPNTTTDRRSGRYYPSCRRKCGPVLAHMLAGLDVEPGAT